MTAKRKIFLGIILFSVFLSIASFAYSTLTKYQAQSSESMNPTITAEKSAESIKQKAPDFTVFDANGNKVKLSDFVGKPVVLNFWASWCPPCKSEMPHFNKVYNTEKNDVVFMMVDLVDGQRETQEKGQQFIQSQGYTFPVYFDLEYQGIDAYGVSSIPTTVFIDRSGNIAAAFQGAISEQTLQKGINSIKAN